MTRLSPRLVMFAALTLSACGPGEPTEPPPPDWMLGEFSSTNIEGHVTGNINRLEIRSDGVARFYSVYGCDHVSEGTEVPWERDGDDAILVWLHGVAMRITFASSSGTATRSRSIPSATGRTSAAKTCIAA